MKYLLFIFLMGCTASAQNQSEETKEDIEFQKLMNKVTQTNDLSVQVQAKASKKEAELVQKAVKTIKELKSEVTILKTELSEVKATLDSVSNDTGVSFRIYAIPNNKEN
jgi:ATP phosphoribosyltransferase regulatory subunit HisZ